MITLNEPQDSAIKSIVLRLGGLHIEMSYLGCIGHIMAGSGLDDVLELVYAKNAVGHMLSGKAISRAIRGYFLVDAVLNSLLVSHTFNLPLLPLGGAPADQLHNNQEEEPPVEAEELEGEVIREACSVDKELEQAG